MSKLLNLNKCVDILGITEIQLDTQEKVKAYYDAIRAFENQDFSNTATILDNLKKEGIVLKIDSSNYSRAEEFRKYLGFFPFQIAKQIEMVLAPMNFDTPFSIDITSEDGKSEGGFYKKANGRYGIKMIPVDQEGVLETITEQKPVQKEKYQWARYSENNYEVSSTGDVRFSAFYAQLQDGRYIEDIYQLDIKGNGKAQAKPKTDPNNPKRSDIRKTGGFTRNVSREQSWKEYKNLWETFLNENPDLFAEIKERAKGKVLTDKFATTEVSQARAIAEILNESLENEIDKEENPLSLLDEFFLSPSPTTREIANVAMALAERIGTPPMNGEMMSDEDFDAFISNQKTTALTEDVTKVQAVYANGTVIFRESLRSGDKDYFHKVLLHEFAHHALDDTLSKDSEFLNSTVALMNDLSSKIKGTSKGVVRLKSIFNNTKLNDLEKAKEFLADVFSNKEVQVALMKIEVEQKFGDDNKTLWDKVVSFFSKYLGLSKVAKNALRETIGLVDYYTAQADVQDTDIDDNTGSAFSVGEETLSFIRADYTYTETEEMADAVISDFNKYAKDRGYASLRENWNTESLDGLSDTSGDLDEEGNAKTKRNWLDAVYAPTQKREDFPKFDGILRGAQPGDLVKIKLVKKVGDKYVPYTDSSGKQMTKWVPLLYVSEGYVQFAKDYGKYNTAYAPLDSVLEYRRMVGEVGEKYSQEVYQDIAKQYNIYNNTDLAERREGEINGQKVTFAPSPAGSVDIVEDGETERVRMYASMDVSETSTEIFSSLEVGDQIAFENTYEKDGKKYTSTLWLPVVRPLAGGVEVATKNGKSYVVPAGRIKRVALNVRQLLDNASDNVKKANNVLKGTSTNSEESLSNSIKNTVDFFWHTSYTRAVEMAKDATEKQNFEEKREYILSKVGKGDMILISIPDKKIRKWVYVVAKGTKGFTYISADSQGKMFVSFAKNENVIGIGFDNTATREVYSAWKKKWETKETKKGTFVSKIDKDQYMSERVSDENRFRRLAELKPGDVVRVQKEGKNGTYTQFYPVVKVLNGNVYIGAFQEDDIEFERTTKTGETYTKTSSKGYRTYPVKESSIVEVAYLMEEDPEIAGSGHALKLERLKTNNKKFSEEFKKENAIKATTAEKADAYNKVAIKNKSPFRFVQAKADFANVKKGEYYKAWAKDGSAVTGIYQFQYVDFSKKGEDFLNTFFERAQKNDYVEMRIKDGKKFKARLLSVGYDALYFTNMQNEVYKVTRNNATTNPKGDGFIFLTAGLKYRKNRDTSWTYKKDTLSAYSEEYTPKNDGSFDKVSRKMASHFPGFEYIDSGRPEIGQVNPNLPVYESGLIREMVSGKLGVSHDIAQSIIDAKFKGVAKLKDLDYLRENKKAIEDTFMEISAELASIPSLGIFGISDFRKKIKVYDKPSAMPNFTSLKSNNLSCTI